MAAVGEYTPLAGDRLLKDAQQQDRLNFIRKVYGILTVQILITVLIATPFLFMSPATIRANQWILVVSSVVLLGTMCSMLCCADQLRKFPQNYGILGVITAAMGVLVGFSISMYTWQSVILAAGITVAVFFGMTLYAWTTKHDFTGMWPYLFGALMVMTAFGFALSIMGICGVQIQWLTMLYNLMGVLLFTFYIVFDTQMLIGGSHKVQFSIDDYCFGALNLYLDIINLFLHLLALFGERR